MWTRITLHNRAMHISGAFRETGAAVAETKGKDSKLPDGSNGGSLDGSLEDRLFELLKSSPEIKISDAARELGVSERSLRRVLDKLKRSGRIERIGGKRFGHWEIHE